MAITINEISEHTWLVSDVKKTNATAVQLRFPRVTPVRWPMKTFSCFTTFSVSCTYLVSARSKFTDESMFEELVWQNYSRSVQESWVLSNLSLCRGNPHSTPSQLSELEG